MLPLLILIAFCCVFMVIVGSAEDIESLFVAGILGLIFSIYGATRVGIHDRLQKEVELYFEEQGCGEYFVASEESERKTSYRYTMPCTPTTPPSFFSNK